MSTWVVQCDSAGTYVCLDCGCGRVPSIGRCCRTLETRIVVCIVDLHASCTGVHVLPAWCIRQPHTVDPCPRACDSSESGTRGACCSCLRCTDNSRAPLLSDTWTFDWAARRWWWVVEVWREIAIAIPRVLHQVLLGTTLELRFLGYPVHPELLQILQSLLHILADRHGALELDLQSYRVPHPWHEVIGA